MVRPSGSTNEVTGGTGDVVKGGGAAASLSRSRGARENSRRGDTDGGGEKYVLCEVLDCSAGVGSGFNIEEINTLLPLVVAVVVIVVVVVVVGGGGGGGGG